MENNNFARGVNYRKLSEKYISLPFLLCLSPLVFLFLGVIISRSPNHRPELIELFDFVVKLNDILLRLKYWSD